MTKDELLKRKRKTKTIDHDSETYTIRKLSAGETATIKNRYQGDAKVMDGMRYVFACAVVDDDANNLFDTSDDKKTAAALKEIESIDYDIVQAVAMAAMEFSGMNVSEARAKND